MLLNWDLQIKARVSVKSKIKEECDFPKMSLEITNKNRTVCTATQQKQNRISELNKETIRSSEKARNKKRKIAAMPPQMSKAEAKRQRTSISGVKCEPDSGHNINNQKMRNKNRKE